MNNPYDCVRPASGPDMFFGRVQIVDDIITSLYAPQPKSYAVFGGRRFGKTSLLREVERLLLERLGASTDLYVVPVYLDLLFESISSREAFFQFVVDSLRAFLAGDYPKLAGALTGPFPPQQDVVHSFEQALLKLFRQALPHTLRVVILIDETERILEHPWTPQLHANLRSLLSIRPATRNQLSILMAGSSPFHTKYKEEGSPLPGILDLCHLAPLSKKETLRLIYEPGGIRVPPLAAEAIWGETAGHPCLTQYIMHELWEVGPETATPGLVVEIAQGFPEHYSAFVDWTKDIGQFGQQVYSFLANQEDWIGHSTLLTRWPSKGLDIVQATERLSFHGLVEQTTDKKRRAIGTMFRRWFCANMLPCASGAHSSVSGETIAGDLEQFPESDEPIPAGRDAQRVEEAASLKRQLANLRHNLLKIEERKTDFIDLRSVPPDIVEAETQIRREITQKEAQLAALQ